MRTPSTRTVDPWLVGPVAALLILTAAPAFVPGSFGPPLAHVAGAPGQVDGSPRVLFHGPAVPGDRPARGGASSIVPSALLLDRASPGRSRGRGCCGAPGSGDLVATLLSVPATVDVGVTVTLTGSASGGTSPYQPYWSFATGNVSAGWSVRWTAPSTERSVLVLFGVRDHSGTFASASATIRVVGPPFLELSSPGVLGDVGVPFEFAANLTGGDGPFTVDWSIPGGSSEGSTVVPSDGTYELAVVPETPGTVWVSGSVVDAWNRSSNGLTPVGRATPPPQLAPASVPFAEVGYPTPVAVGVADGTPPFAWSVPAGRRGHGGIAGAGVDRRRRDHRAHRHV